MKTFENIYKADQLLRNSRYPVSLETVRETLGCSRSTAQRVIGYLRDLLGAPIETTADPAGYRYTDQAFELPGLWFSGEQIQALLLLQQVLECFQPGLLNDVLKPLRKRLYKILETQGLLPAGSNRIRMLKMAARSPGPTSSKWPRPCCSASASRCAIAPAVQAKFPFAKFPRSG